MSLSFLPNLLCIVRMLMVYPVAAWILEGRYPQVMALFALAAFTDALDGSLAKRYGWTSELGKHLDPLADKLLLMTVFVCLSVTGMVPWLVTALVLLRDLVISFGALTYRVLFGPVHGNPTSLSKCNTLAQIVFCLAVVSAAAYQWPNDWLVTALGALVVVTTGASGNCSIVTAGCTTRPGSQASCAARMPRPATCWSIATDRAWSGCGVGAGRASRTSCRRRARQPANTARRPRISTWRRARRTRCWRGAKRWRWSVSIDQHVAGLGIRAAHEACEPGRVVQPDPERQLLHRHCGLREIVRARATPVARRE